MIGLYLPSYTENKEFTFSSQATNLTVDLAPLCAPEFIPSRQGCTYCTRSSHLSATILISSCTYRQLRRSMSNMDLTTGLSHVSTVFACMGFISESYTFYNSCARAPDYYMSVLLQVESLREILALEPIRSSNSGEVIHAKRQMEKKRSDYYILRKQLVQGLRGLEYTRAEKETRWRRVYLLSTISNLSKDVTEHPKSEWMRPSLRRSRVKLRNVSITTTTFRDRSRDSNTYLELEDKINASNPCQTTRLIDTGASKRPDVEMLSTVIAYISILVPCLTSASR